MIKVLKFIGKAFLFIIGLVLQIILLINYLNLYLDYDPPAPEIRKSDKLNIVWMLAEDLSPDLPAYGDSTARTPNLDKLAKEGIVFDLAFTTQPICAPSKSCLYTGQYQTYLGTHQMRTSWKDYEAVPPPGTKVFTEYLRKAGYYASKSGHADYQFGTALTAWDEISEGFFSLKRIRHWRERKDNQPFFSSIDIMATHESQQWMNPFAGLIVDPSKVQVPPYYADDIVIREDLAMMYSNIVKMDAEVGKIITKLEEDGLEDNTVVIFMGDHGRGMPRNKRWLYDGGLKVPMIIKWPGKLDAGTRSSQMVSFVDMAPTMMSILGLDIPDHMQGKVFLGDNIDPNPRQYIYGSRDRADEATDKIRAVRDHRYKYILNLLPDTSWTQTLTFRDLMPTMKKMRELNADGKLTGGAAYWFSDTKPKEELYDTWNDPFEIQNLSGDPTFDSIKFILVSKLNNWMNKYDRYIDITEEDMIKTMWPDNIQPVTSTPEINTKADSGNLVVQLQCDTEGATIEYKVNNQAGWSIYNKPFRATERSKITIRALRYGYKMSDQKKQVI